MNKQSTNRTQYVVKLPQALYLHSVYRSEAITTNTKTGAYVFQTQQAAQSIADKYNGQVVEL